MSGDVLPGIKTGRSREEVKIDSLKKAYLVARLAQEKKAEDIKILDMRAVSNFCDFFILLTSVSSRRAEAIAEAIKEGMREKEIAIKDEEGEADSGWLLLDLFDVVVHIFDAGSREFFNLDKLWADAPALEFPLTKHVYRQDRAASKRVARQNSE